MLCPRPTFKEFIFPNTFIVFATILLGDMLYSWSVTGSFGGYFGKDIVSKIIYTLLLSGLYAWVYTRASRIWRDGDPPQVAPPEGVQDPSVTPFMFKNGLRSGPVSCKGSPHKIFNGMLFSFLMCAGCFLALLLCSYFLLSIYVFVFHGIRGEFSIDTGAAAVKTAEIVIAGAVLERHGKTESDGDA